MSDYDNIQNALNHIDPQDRETWFRMGAAIKDELGENGFEMWDNWSRQASNYKQTDAQAVWKSIKTGHIHIATLFKAARENGYRPETPYTPPSPEMLAQRTREAQERQRAEAERIAQAHAKAEKTAYGIWKNASPADPKHAYAQSKGLDADTLKGIRQNEYQGKKQLIIPLYSEKKLVNVQIIDEDGNKKFLNGGQKQGAYTVIGDFKQNQQGIVLTEGFATAASVHQATGKPVVVAFDAGNLKAVSEKLLRALPENVPVYFAADNDPNHIGEHKAQAAAKVWGNRAQILLPEFNEKQIAEFQENYGADKMPTDFNDLHKLAGIEAVQRSFGEMLERDFRQPEMEHVKPELSREELLKNNYWRVANGYDPLPKTQLETNQSTQTATSDKDVAVSFTAQDNMMKNKDKFELGQAVKHEFPHFTDISLVVGKSPNGYVLLDDEPVRSPYLREVDGTEFQASTDKAWLSSLVYENKNAEKAYEIFEQNQSRFGSEYEWIGKADFMKAFGQQLELEQETTQQTDFRQPENEREPSFYDYNFEDLPTERPTVAPPQPEKPAATSEKDVAVSTSEADEPEQEMPNRIEYDGLQHEIRLPENPTPPKSELETDEPKQEKSQVNTGLDYEVPEHLKSRMVAVDTQRFRVANYEMGAHLLRYVAPDNPKTVLFEDKGKSIHTARDDKQTIQDMLDVAKAKGWDSIKISGSQEFKQQMWLEAESRGIATKGYKPSPEDLAILEQRRAERATNSIAEAEKLKQQSAVQERSDSSAKTIPTEAVKAADTVKAHATQAQQTTQPSDTAKAQYENKLATLPTDQQHKARFYERLALNALRHMPAEFHEKTRQAIYENQADLIHDGKYHAPDPMKSVERQPEKEKSHERAPSRDDDWEMER